MTSNNKAILITGGAGFVGHQCVDYLLENTDWNIIVLDSLNYAGNMNRIVDLRLFGTKRVKFIWDDLRSPISETTRRLIGKLDYLIHFAAESHVDRSLEDSIPFIESNVVGTANLMEYLKRYQQECKTLIFSTDEVFGSAPKGVFFKEDYWLKPSNPYSASKVGQEMIAFSFAHSFNLPISIVRSMNIIGERQHPEKFVPKTIRTILNNEKVILHGKHRDDLSSRCWIYVKDVMDSLFFLLNKGEKEEFYHITGEEKTVLEMADWICEIIKGRKLRDDEIEFVDYHTARPGHDQRYALNGEKLARLGWTPPHNLEEALKKTVEWSLKNKKWLDL